MPLNWDDILYLKGKPVLWVVSAKTPRGVVAAPIDNPTRKTRLTHTLDATFLKDILLYGRDGEDVPLRTVYEHFHQAFGADLPVSPKATDAELRRFFEEHAPMLDVERIYTSHMRKIVKWYHQLTGQGLTFEPPASDDGDADTSDATDESNDN